MCVGAKMAKLIKMLFGGQTRMGTWNYVGLLDGGTNGTLAMNTKQDKYRVVLLK